VKLAKEKAIPFIKQKLGGVKHRIKNFLQDKWNRLKEKLGIKKPGQAGKKGADKGAKGTTDIESNQSYKSGYGGVQPMPADFQAAFIDAQGQIVGYGNIDVLVDASGKTRVKVVE
jgi:hypothetical protein